MKAIIALE